MTARLTRTQRDALWRFLAAEYVRGQRRDAISASEHREMQRAEYEAFRRGAVVSQRTIAALVKAGMLERDERVPAICRVTTAGRAALKGET